MKLYDKKQISQKPLLFDNHALFLLLVPIVVEQLLNSFMGMVDTMMVSTVGSEAISAVSLVDSFNNLVIQVFSAMAAGAAIICSQYLGSGNAQETNKAARQVVLTVTAISTVVMLVCLLGGERLLRLIFGEVEEEVMKDCLVYFLITVVSYPFLALFSVFAALRKPRQVIVIRDYLRFRPDMPLIWKIMAIGIPSGIENGMFQFGKLAIQSTVSTMGTAAIAAQAMASILEGLNGMCGIGIGIGLMTVVGQCIGAGRYEEAKYYIVKLTKAAWVSIVISCLVVFAITKPVTWLAGMEAESAKLCFEMVTAITIVKPFAWVGSFIISYGLRAAGDVQFSMIVSTVTMWCCRVVLCIFLVKVYQFGPMAVWIGMFADWTARSVIFTGRFLSGKWLPVGREA